MGVKLKQIIDLVTSEAGNNGRIRLAELTGIPSGKASEMPETEEILSLFKRVASEIMHEDINLRLGK
jgi:hypothetical protein